MGNAVVHSPFSILNYIPAIARRSYLKNKADRFHPAQNKKATEFGGLWLREGERISSIPGGGVGGAVISLRSALLSKR
jgi:hypothetical protein